MDSSSQSERWMAFVNDHSEIPNHIPEEWVNVYKQMYHDWVIADHTMTHGPRDDNRSIRDHLVDTDGNLRGTRLSNEPSFQRFKDYLVKTYDAKTDKQPQTAVETDFLNPNQFQVPLAGKVKPVKSELVNLENSEQHFSITGHRTLAERTRDRDLDLRVNPPTLNRPSGMRRFSNNILRGASSNNDVQFY